MAAIILYELVWKKVVLLIQKQEYAWPPVDSCSEY